jgi:hypothetical protein
MRLLIDTSGVQFRVAAQAKPRADYKDKDRQATGARTRITPLSTSNGSYSASADIRSLTSRCSRLTAARTRFRFLRSALPPCGSPSATRTRPAPPTGQTRASAARSIHSCSPLVPVTRSNPATSTGPSTSGALATASAASRSTTPVAPAARCWPRSTFTRASRWPSSGIAVSRSRWRSTPRFPTR